MQFLKILFWCLISFTAAIFTYGNWVWVTINLWGGLVAEVNLPFMMLLTFLAGVLPTWLYYRTMRWRLTQRLATAERVIADLKPVVPMGADPGPTLAAPVAAAAPRTPPNQPPLELTP
jgi:hypothetical protein